MKQRWLKCDLHMHSHHSKFTKDGDKKRVKELTAKEYVDILLEKDINIFSITDHNIFSNDYYSQIRSYISDKDIRIINGVELDVYVDDKNYFQMGTYFDNCVDGEKLENIIKELYNGKKPKFSEIINKLVSLECKFIMIPEGDKPSHGITGIIKKLTETRSVEEIKELNKYAMYKIFSGFDIRKQFNNEGRNHWANSFFQNTETFKHIIGEKKQPEIDLLISEINEKLRDYKYEFSNDDTLKIYDYIVKYGNYFAYFSFSDWHNAEPYNPQIYNYIFGNLELYFESFELAVLDPISRIIMSKEEDVHIPSNILSELKFDINGIEKTVEFSPGLNAIIGKRGSGKSLLLTVIESLKDKSNNKLKEYKELNIKDIVAKDYNGISINPGQLSSIAVLRQDHVSAIYNDPNLANKEISSYFLDIEEFDLSYMKEIIELLKKIKPYDKNHKNLTSTLSLIRKTNYFSYKTYKDIQADLLFNKILKITTDLESIIVDFGKIGINTSNLEQKNKELKQMFNNYEYIINQYKYIIDNNNENVKKLTANRDTSQKVMLEQKNNLDKIIASIIDNFEITLNIKKLNLLIENPKISSPKIRKKRKGNFLFVTSYAIPEDLINNIIEKIASTISKNKGDALDLKLINLYVNGDRNLQSTKNSLSDDLFKYTNDDVFKPKKEFYKVLSKFDENDILDNDDLIDNVKKGNLIDLSKASPGVRSVAYLDMLFDLSESILLFDQPEDNIDNEYISETLVALIKEKKKSKQLIFVTHNPSLAVYGDAFNYIYVENEGEIKYKNYLIERRIDKKSIMNILEGGASSFVNRDKKYGNMLGEEEYGTN